MTQTNRQKPMCTAFTKAGEPCRGVAVTTQNARLLCRVHAGLVDQAELGRRSVAARKARKSKGSLVDSIRRRFSSDPDRIADALLSSARGVELAVELVAKEEAKSGGETAALPPSVASRVTYADVIGMAAREGQEHHIIGFELTDAQRAQVVAEYERRHPERHADLHHPPGESRNPASSRYEKRSFATGDPDTPAPFPTEPLRARQAQPLGELEAFDPSLYPERSAALRRELGLKELRL